MHKNGEIIFDINKIVRKADPVICEILSLDRDSLLNKSFMDKVHKTDHVSFHFNIRKAFETKTPCACEIRLKKSNGDILHTRFYNTLINGTNGTEFCKTLITDLTGQN